MPFIVLGVVFALGFVLIWGETKKSIEQKGGTPVHGGFVLLGLLASIWLSALFLLIFKEYAFFFANLIIAIVFTIAAAFIVAFSAPSSNKEDISESDNYDD